MNDLHKFRRRKKLAPAGALSVFIHLRCGNVLRRGTFCMDRKYPKSHRREGVPISPSLRLPPHKGQKKRDSPFFWSSQG